MHWHYCCIQVSYTHTFAARAKRGPSAGYRAATTHKQMNEWIGVHYTLDAIIALMWCQSFWLLYAMSRSVTDSRCPYTWCWSGWKARDKQETGTGQIIMSKKQEIPSSHLTWLEIILQTGMSYLFRIWQNDILDWWNNNNVMLKLLSSVVQLTWARVTSTC